MANTLGGVLLPNLTVQEDDEGYVGSSIRRAVDGTPHVFWTGDVTRWRLTCSYITYAQYMDLLQVKEAAKSGPVAFHLDEWGSGLRYVFIVEFRARRTPYAGPNGWDPSGRTVDITLEEAFRR